PRGARPSRSRRRSPADIPEARTGRALRGRWGCARMASRPRTEGASSRRAHRDTRRARMPLSEDEQRILREIEANLSVTDPKLVQQVSDTTLYRHATRMVKYSVLGFIAGLVLLLTTFTSVLALGVLGFLVMLACLLVIERNVRKMGRAGLES